MIGDRGVSTPLDVAVGLLLVGAAVGVIAGMQPTPDPGSAVTGSVLLGSTLEVTYPTDDGNATVTGTMGGLVGDAVLAGHGNMSRRDRAFREAVQSAVDRRLDTHNRPVQIVGYCSAAGDTDTLIAGRSVPPDRPIRAAVYEVPGAESMDPEGTTPASDTAARSSAATSSQSGPSVGILPSALVLTDTGFSGSPGLDARTDASRNAGPGQAAGSRGCEPAVVVRRWSR